MPIVEDSDWKRRDKAQRHYRLRDLPMKHNAEQLASEVPDRERGAGRVLQEMMRTSQGNFDHLSAELKRFATLHNAGEADTQYLKELLDPHEHPSSAPTHEDLLLSDAEQVEAFGGPGGFWYASYATGQNIFTATGADRTVPTNAVRVVPFWPGKNMHVDQVRIECADVQDQTLFPVVTQHPNEYRIHVAIYLGDNPGNMPGSRMVYAGNALADDGSSAISRFNIDELLQGGTWHWFAACITPEPGAVWAPQFSGVTTIDTFDNFGAGFSYSWPFHGLEQGANHEQTVAYDYPWTGVAADPFPEFLETDDATYARSGPTIEVRSK